MTYSTKIKKESVKSCAQVQQNIKIVKSNKFNRVEEINK